MGLLASSCALTVVLVLGWAWRHRTWLQEPILEHGVTDAGFLDAVRAWRESSPGIPKAALLSNSLIECKDGVSVGVVTDRLLAARHAPYALFATWAGAFGPLQFYEALDEVLAGRPRVVIVEVDSNRLVVKDFPVGMRYLALSRKLSFERALRVRTALAREELTLLDPLLYRLEERVDMTYVVPGVREHWSALLARWGDAVNQAAAVRTTPIDRRFLRALYRNLADRIARDPNESPLVPVLRRIGEEIRRAGARVLFYVPPMNDVLLGPPVSDRELRVRQRVDRLRMAIGAAPEEWLDLHDALPSEAFRDWTGHMFPVGCERVSESIVDAVLARHLPGDGAR